ncbi:ATP-dependent DNA helicase PIF1 [Senna tora]|uniref:ATP-dependent DNA helicase n=1 Tax=Senna tora TaxID=362788 RepID=A0A834WRL0_9FABA|nr:ATP-dependent DNA helicase PIF1 [Senna tora]
MRSCQHRKNFPSNVSILDTSGNCLGIRIDTGRFAGAGTFAATELLFAEASGVKAMDSISLNTSRNAARSSISNNIWLKLIRKHNSDARTYNLSTTSKVAALIVGDFDIQKSEMDIIVENRYGLLQRINELHPLYLPMQYPLIFLFHQKNLRSVNYVALTEASSRDLFITFTCNLRWPELDKLFDGVKCRAEDRPDLVSRIFKIKLNKLMRDVTKDMLFGRCMEAHPVLHEAVKNFMILGPCDASRASSPCMVNGKYSKHFPESYNERTSFEEDEYAKYHCRESGNTVVKNDIELDNHFVVPYNPTLLLRYQAHINVEFCNQLMSIKYLFKEPAVERISFHFPNQQGIVFADEDHIDDVVWSGELHYLRVILTFVVGPTLYEDIKTINGLLHPMFKDACYVMGLLDDDKEYIDGIIDVSKCHQKNVYDSVMDVVTCSESDVFFVNGFGGSSKTFIWNTLTSAICSRGDIVLAGSRTTLSRFVIPLDCNDNFTCNIMQGNDLAYLAILAPTLNDVASINNHMLLLLPGEKSVYLSSDSISSQDQDSELACVYATEFLNTLSGSGLPYHELRLKVGAHVMLLRNIDKSLGLCNGTRLIVTRLCKQVIEAFIISGKFIGET